MSNEKKVTAPIMDGATEATAAERAEGLRKQAEHDHPDSQDDRDHDLNLRAEEARVEPNGRD